ncbi:MAG: hypothetical protein AB3N11_05875 [Arenibacterium sp.]
MIETDLSRKARLLEAKISAANEDSRVALQPELHHVLELMRREGNHVPARLRNLNAVLLDEAIERRFDNLPV